MHGVFPSTFIKNFIAGMLDCQASRHPTGINKDVNAGTI
jgi:hypothetical protein